MLSSRIIIAALGTAILSPPAMAQPLLSSHEPVVGVVCTLGFDDLHMYFFADPFTVKTFSVEAGPMQLDEVSVVAFGERAATGRTDFLFGPGDIGETQLAFIMRAAVSLKADGTFSHDPYGSQNIPITIDRMTGIAVVTGSTTPIECAVSTLDYTEIAERHDALVARNTDAFLSRRLF